LKLTGEEGKTHMTYEGSAQVGGRIASVGQRLMETSAKSIIRQSLEGLNEYLKVQVVINHSAQAVGGSADQITEVSETTPALGYHPPSQANVALNLLKDVFSDFVPAQYRPVIVVSFAILLILLVYRISKK